MSQRSVCPFIPVNIFELHQLYVGLWTFHSVTSSHEHYFQNICQILPLSISSALALVNYTTTFLLDYCSVHYLISLCPFFIHSKPFFTNWEKKKNNSLNHELHHVLPCSEFLGRLSQHSTFIPFCMVGMWPPLTTISMPTPCLTLEFHILTTLDPFSFLTVPRSLHCRTLRPVFFLLVTLLPFPPLDPG